MWILAHDYFALKPINMKIALQLILLTLLSTASLGQSNITLQINHLLDGVQFENEVNSTNDLGNDFMINRLQYYLSGFSITHDGGCGHRH